MNSKTIKTTASIALLTIMTLAVATAAVAPAMAQTTDSAALNTTVDVDNGTRAIYVSALNATGTLDVSIEANGTEVGTATLDATANSSDSWEWTLPTDQADQYRVIVSGADAEMVDVDLIERVDAGGGGIIPSASISGVPLPEVVGVLALVALLAAIGLRSENP